MQDSLCTNCGLEMVGKYCHHCGQTSGIGRITFKDTLKQFLSASFSFEGPLLYTIKYLFLNPGKVFREFIDGKRKTYYKPVSFFVLLTAVYILLRLLLNYDPLEGQTSETGSKDANYVGKKSIAAAKYMVNHINYLMIFLILSIGLILKLFFSKKYYFAEYIAVGSYIAGMYVIVGIFFMLLSKYFSIHNSQIQLIFLFLIVLYCTWSLFNRLTFWLSFKYLMSGIFIVLLYSLLSFGFAFLMVSA